MMTSASENEALVPVTNSISLLVGVEREVVRGCESEAEITLFLVDAL